MRRPGAEGEHPGVMPRAKPARIMAAPSSAGVWTRSGTGGVARIQVPVGFGRRRDVHPRDRPDRLRVGFGRRGRFRPHRQDFRLEIGFGRRRRVCRSRGQIGRPRVLRFAPLALQPPDLLERRPQHPVLRHLGPQSRRPRRPAVEHRLFDRQLPIPTLGHLDLFQVRLQLDDPPPRPRQQLRPRRGGVGQAGEDRLDPDLELVRRDVHVRLIVLQAREDEGPRLVRRAAGDVRRQVERDQPQHRRVLVPAVGLHPRQRQRPPPLAVQPGAGAFQRRDQVAPAFQHRAAAPRRAAERAEVPRWPEAQILEVVLDHEGVRAVGLGPGRRDPAGHGGGLGASDAVEPPRGLDGGPDEVALEVGAGVELVGPGVEAVLQRLGVLAGQDERRGAEAVLQAVQFGSRLARRGPRAGRLLAILSIDLAALFVGECHLGGPARAEGSRCMPCTAVSSRPPRGRPANRAGKAAGSVLAPESSESPSPPDLFNRASSASPGRSGRIVGKSVNNHWG